jgi:hypothetical protein
MNIINVFDEFVARIECNDSTLYHNEELIQSINMVFQSPYVINRDRKINTDSHKGEGLTTVGQPYPITDLPGIDNLIKWIDIELLKFKNELGIAKEKNNVYYKKSWANQLKKGGYGLCHKHLTQPDVVAIFYVDVPKNSSDLIFVKNGKDYEELKNINEEDIYTIQPIEGELIIHSPNLWHAVGMHNNDLPRNVFVFDIDYV